MTDWGELVDLEACTVSPRAFTHDGVYRDEQERVFEHPGAIRVGGLT